MSEPKSKTHNLTVKIETISATDDENDTNTKLSPDYPQSQSHLTPDNLRVVTEGGESTNSRRLSGSNISVTSFGYSDSEGGAGSIAGGGSKVNAGNASTTVAADTSNTTSPVMGTPNSSSNKPVRRRPHSKSRRGCSSCKKRRVKCDETHPRCRNCLHLGLECSFTINESNNSQVSYSNGPLNMVDLKLFHNYTSVVWKTITSAGISNDKVWGEDVPNLAFEYPFLMRCVMTFSATHLSRTHKGIYDNAVSIHRGEALRLLREEVQQVTPKNVDALVAASVLLILDALANAALPEEMSSSSLPPSAWLHHVRGAATILLAVGPLPPESRFYRLVNVDLSDLADTKGGLSAIAQAMTNAGLGGLGGLAGLNLGNLGGLSGGLGGLAAALGGGNEGSFANIAAMAAAAAANNGVGSSTGDAAQLLLHQGGIPGMAGALSGMSGLVCFDDDLKDLYPVHTSSPYFQTLVYIDKLFHQRYKSDFILRVFSFPALLDRNLLNLLSKGDDGAKRIIRVYYKLVRSFTSEMKDKVWFLEGVSKVLPIDLDSDFGGLGFITSALPVSVTLETMLRPFEETDVGSIVNRGAGRDSSSSLLPPVPDEDDDMMTTTPVFPDDSHAEENMELSSPTAIDDMS